MVKATFLDSESAADLAFLTSWQDSLDSFSPAQDTSFGTNAMGARHDLVAS